jgi:sugar lactone lactonase YvrE
MSQLPNTAVSVVTGSLAAFALGALVFAQATAPADKTVPFKSTMVNPYRLVENWPKLGNIAPGPAIGIIPDGKGGVWLLHRSDPPLLHIDAAGNVVKTMAEGLFGTVHAFCRDRDGNFWAGDSGPFGNTNPEALKKAYVVHKFSPEGKLLLTIGKPGVQKSGEDTFIGPAACISAPNGDIIIADGHHPRPLTVEGDRLVRYSKDGKFIRAYGKQGTAPGEFMGPHSLAYDSEGRLFVADRSNNRIQIFDKDMNFVDEWRHFGRPSGVAILKDDTLVVSDSESSYTGFRPAELGPPGPEVRGVPRNAGWQPGIRVGNAKDGSLRYFISATRPEGMGADDQGDIFGGLTGQCSSAGADRLTPGGPNCLQKWVKK